MHQVLLAANGIQRGSETLRAYYRLISHALKQTRHLQVLTLPPLDRQECRLLLDDLFLPNLRDICITARKTSYISKFLHRHPKIDQLIVLGQIHDCDLRMPALYSLIGHHSLIRDLARSSSSLTEIHISWHDATDADYECSLKPLARSPVKDVTCSAFVWSSHFFDALTRHIPHLDTIRLKCDSEPTDSVS